MVCDGERTEPTLALPDGRVEKQQFSLLQRVASKKSLWAQCLMNVAIVMLVTGSGMPTGFSAILLPQLQANSSSLPTDDEAASWIASVHSVMTPIGSLLAGPLMDRIGRRRVLQISVVPMVAGWLIMSVAPDHFTLAAGRMLAGLAVGMTPGPSQVLVGETSEPSLRGVLSSSPNLAYSLGILVVYSLGCVPSVLSWRGVAAVSTVLPVTAFLLLAALPESPVWLVNQGNVDKARKSLLWLRGGDSSKASHELHLLVVNHKSEQDRQSTETIDENISCFPGRVISLKRPEVYKPFFIIFFFCLLQILSGSYIVIFYSVSLISSTNGGGEMDQNSLTIAVITAFVRFVVSIITTISLIRLGRRKIGLISGVGTALACFLLVGFLEINKRQWIQLDDGVEMTIISVLIMVYVAFNTFGIFGLPCLMIGEVLPASVRGVVTGILLTLINLVNFTTTKLYPFAAQLLGPSGVFFGFALASTTATIYIYLFLPETKNHPLTQIEQYFAEGKNFLWATRDKTLLPRNKKNKQPV